MMKHDTSSADEISLLQRASWKWFVFRIRLRDLIDSFPDKAADLRRRLRGDRSFAYKPLQFGDGLDGSASQKHAVLISYGLFGWRETGIVYHWRCDAEGAEKSSWEIDGERFESCDDAIAASDDRMSRMATFGGNGG